ncbi:type IV conjugative transfer system pilin TraA [Proteus mirabilis]|uniref:type IV conjugative transfer system pilin TraA n=1 Tax=Enterobacterales TaxID=91347 RepID=UPI000E054F72|nr:MULTISPECIES: type IV conjugative transfer system pilin TraA [Proteus]ELA7740709.1 type IV conjugative transfer system pilin TraA [Proteus mirabilis]MBG2905381.1 TraA fimbrial protein precursor [Proteus mirabilis]MBG3156665.1 TraA fimbrial protein precursor [Proteus mirabilis]MBG5994295.1 TraA fimbrial protein precursor [Proteus mirabilis]MBI6207651.1 type IV conjugative transfer system pilin TraA [Proteus mirabilis]
MKTNQISLKNKTNYFLENKSAITTLMLFAIGLIIMMMPTLQAHADDLFASGKEQVKDSFGKDSTIIYILYVIEILMAVFTYIRTKNLMMMGGIAAVMIFVNVAFGLF